MIADSAASPPLCPICGAEMARRLAQQGPRAGLEFWGCRRYPACKGIINIDPAPQGQAAVLASRPAAYAHERHMREVRRSRLKRRAALPLLIGATVVAVSISYVAMQPLGTAMAALGATVVGIVLFLAFLLRMPFDSLVWTKGMEGERKTAEYLEPLMSEGFIALYNRLLEGLDGDIDCLLIGPRGVFVIETKNWDGKVTVRPRALLLGDSDRTWAVEQVHRTAVAVQIALRDDLNRVRLTVTPVLSLIGGVGVGGTHNSGVEITGAKKLVAVVQSHPKLLDDADVRAIARLAESRLRQQYVWDIA